MNFIFNVMTLRTTVNYEGRLIGFLKLLNDAVWPPACVIVHVWCRPTWRPHPGKEMFDLQGCEAGEINFFCNVKKTLVI